MVERNGILFDKLSEIVKETKVTSFEDLFNNHYNELLTLRHCGLREFSGMIVTGKWNEPWVVDEFGFIDEKLFNETIIDKYGEELIRWLKFGYFTTPDVIEQSLQLFIKEISGA